MQKIHCSYIAILLYCFRDINTSSRDTSRDFNSLQHPMYMLIISP